MTATPEAFDTGRLPLLVFSLPAAVSGQVSRDRRWLQSKADEWQGKGEDCARELEQFLNEEPTGTRADQLRPVLANFHANVCAH